MEETILERGKILELQQELRLTKMVLKELRLKIELAISLAWEIDELPAELPKFKKAAAEYETAINEFSRLKARLTELGG